MGNLCIPVNAQLRVNSNLPFAAVLLCGNVDSTRSNAIFISCFQPYIAIDAGTGISSAVGVFMHDFYQPLVFPIHQRVCYFAFKRGIAVFLFPNQPVVNINGRIHIYAVET